MKRARSLRLSLVALIFMVAGTGAGHAEDSEPRTCLVDFTFELQGDRKGAPRGALRLRPVDGDDPWQVVEIRNGAAQSRLEVGRSWMTETEAPGLWGPKEVLNLGEDCTRRTHRVPVWPTGRLSGKILVDDSRVKLPEQISARLRSLQKPGAQAPRAIGRVDCEVDREKGTWSCELPASPLNLIFSADDLAPIYRLNVPVQPSEDRREETLRFRTGAAVAGYVEIEDGDLSPKCQARLTPLEVGPSSRSGSARLRKKSTPVDERGFFQLTGLPTGAYSLEIEQPGFATQKIFPLDLYEGREVFLRDPVVLRRPLDIEIRITPPRDWLEESWNVMLLRASAHSAQFEDAPVFKGPADETGRVSVPEQAPGRYSLSISDSAGNPFYSEFLLQIDEAADASMDIDLDLVVVEGEVSLGDRPVSGELFFGGRYGERSVRLPIEAEGTFQGILPSEGLWEVDIDGQNPELSTTVEVTVDIGPSGRALLDIELPDTQIFGQVVDEGGKTVEGARVSLSTELGNIHAVTDEQGDFQLRAVPENIGWLSAKLSTSSGRRTSESIGLSVIEGQPTGPVILRLLENRQVRGVVLGPQGPVAGAQVRLRPTGSALPIVTKAKTELDGSFAADVPSTARRLEAVVSAPGHALRIMEIAVPEAPSESIQLHVPARGGTLEITTGRPNGWRLDVLQGGRLFSLQTLYEWTMAHDGGFERGDNETTKMTIPQLAADEYRICLRPTRAESYGAASDPPIELIDGLREQGQCFSGYLGVAARLAYTFDDPK